MVFSSPSMLWALGLLAIPIIIHLFQFRRYKKLYFSDTSLFQEIKAQSQTKNQIKHLLVLLARLLFITCLVLAFAKPIIPAANSEASAPDIISIYIDNSFSMTAQGTNGDLLSEAREIAYRLVEQYPAGTQLQLITNALKANEKRLIDLPSFKERLDQIDPSGKYRTLNQVIRFQQESLIDEAATTSRLVLISDFNGTLPSSDAPIKTDSSQQILYVPLAVEAMENLSIDSVWTEDPIHLSGVDQIIHYRISNRGIKDILDQEVDISINDRRVAAPILSIPSGESIDTSFHFTPDRAGFLTGQLQIDDKPIAYDNDLFFSLEVKERIKVVEVSPDKKSVPSPFERLFDGPYFNYTQLEASAVIQDSLEDVQLMIVRGVDEWNLGLSSILDEHLQRGGNVLITPPPIASEDFRQALFERYGFEIGTMDTVSTEVSTVASDHPLLDGVFETLNDDINLPFVGLTYRLKSTPGSSILSLPGGQPFLGSNASYSGNVFFMTSPVEASYSSFTEHALFVPIMINMATRSGYPAQMSYPIEVSIIPWSGPKDETLVMQRTDKEESFIPGLSYNGLLMNEQVDRPGFYTISSSEQGYRPVTVAFNYNRKESSFRPIAPEAIANAFENPEEVKDLESDLSTLRTQIVAADLGTALWAWFIMLALLFILLEVVLLKIFSP